jgi:hypothetical protein
MAVKAKAAPARTITRDAPVVAAPVERMPERDPHVILNREGKPINIDRITTQNDDRYDLAGRGVVAPDGWVYAWRTVSIKGAPATQEIADDEMRGWTPVPASRHDGKIMPRGHVGNIELGGLMLKERPARAEAISRAASTRAANDQLNISRSMTGLMQRHSPNVNDLFDQADPAAKAASFVRTERIPMGDPNRSKNYTYSLDE